MTRDHKGGRAGRHHRGGHSGTDGDSGHEAMVKQTVVKWSDLGVDV
ncbi:MAG: hypothetical protein IPJ98_22125 [Bryobacterales bacterium]|nr:hypothetical protein [Bryobacterales bacterium]